MRRVSYASVLERAAVLFNGDPDPTAEDAALLNVFLNRRLEECWQQYWWPEWTPVEKRYFAPFWDVAETYHAGDFVYYSPGDEYYQCLPLVTVGTVPGTSEAWAEAQLELSADDWVATTAYVAGDQIFYATTGYWYQCLVASTGDLPTDTTHWCRLYQFYREVEYEATGETKIAECRRVWDADPEADAHADTITFQLRSTGIIVWTSDASCWVEFRLEVPSYSGAAWAAATTYAADDQVYVSSEGDYYKALQASTNKNPVTETTYWERIEFPRILRDAVAQGAYADMLRADGQNDKFVAEEQEFRRQVARAIGLIQRQQGQTPQLNVVSRNPV